MPAAMRSTKRLRTFCRFASLLAYGGALSIYHHAQPIAAKAYNEPCAGQGMLFGEPTSVGALLLVLLVAAVPVLLVRGTASVMLNLGLGLVELVAAMSLLATAGRPPYECFTQAGTYEDHVSGLGEFELASVLLVLLSHLLLAVDLLTRMVRGLMARSSAEDSGSQLSRITTRS
ncbi:hypothetical protein [Bradyrhizobium sp. ORS 285]|uniref:hypothetical protein n=1 Tax=Bradyrhizobium sp. ORS 285 TaxID=115808 RepID=UPI00054E7502|nr:hypothetical protein [Bradyrhizobium sp. ORS 285]